MNRVNRKSDHCSLMMEKLGNVYTSKNNSTKQNENMKTKLQYEYVAFVCALLSPS